MKLLSKALLAFAAIFMVLPQIVQLYNYDENSLNIKLYSGNVLLQQNQSKFAFGNNENVLNFTVSNYIARTSYGSYDSGSVTFQLNGIVYKRNYECSNCTTIEFTNFGSDMTKFKWNFPIEICMLYRNDPNVIWFTTFGETRSKSSINQLFILINSNGLGVIFSELIKVYWKDLQLCFIPPNVYSTTREYDKNSIIIINSRNFKSAVSRSYYKFEFLSKIYSNFKRETKQVDANIMTYPIWSYSSFGDFSQENLLNFALSIKEIYKFNSSLLQIDVDWQKHDGDFAFDFDRWGGEPTKLFNELHKKEFNITFTANPFISEFSANFERFKYMMSQFGQDYVMDQNVGGMLNLSREAVSDWTINRFEKLSNKFEIDSMLFEGGKFGTFNEKLLFRNSTPEVAENSIKAYFYAERSSLTSLEFPLFVQIDIKASNNFAHNLKSLIPMALSMSMAGHSNIVPNLLFDDEADKPSYELYIRWVQAVALMPVMKFTIAPWLYNQTAVQITHKFTALHAEYAEIMMKSAKETDRYNGYSKQVFPIIRPLWYVFPYDNRTNGIEDQFMLGDKIMVAPVLEEGQRERDVYFPSGIWTDRHDNGFTGPGLFNVRAPLDELPYFKLFERRWKEEL